MGVAHVQHVGHQVLGQFAVAVEAPVRMALPGTDVHLVDVDAARAASRAPAARLQPLGVAPDVSRRRAHARGGAGTQLEAARVGIGLDHDRAGGAVADLELVQRARGQAGDEQLPDAARAAHCPSDARARPSD